MALIRSVMDAGNEVIIGIRDTAVDVDNPYTVEQREQMIRAEFGESVRVCVVPDFDEIVIGRKVGYEIRQVRLNPEIEAISGTDIRRRT